MYADLQQASSRIPDIQNIQDTQLVSHSKGRGNDLSRFKHQTQHPASVQQT